MIFTGARFGVGVDDGAGQARQRVQQAVLGVHGHLVGPHDGAGGVHDDVAFGAQIVADPAEADVAHGEDAGGGGEGGFGAVDEVRVHGVHEAAPHFAGRLPEDERDRDSDEQAHHRVGPGGAQRDAPGPQAAGQGSEAVRAGVKAVRDEGRTVCLVEHNLDVVRELSDHTYFMELGEITASGTLAELTGSARLAEAYFGAQ